MNIAVLASPESWYLRDLRRAAGDAHTIVQATYRDLAAGCGGIPNRAAVASTSGLLHEFDAVLVRTMPPGSLEQVVFRMDALAQLNEIVPVVNPPRALEAAVDKYLSSARLAAAGLPTPRTWVSQTVEQALRGYDAFAASGSVLKPLFGSEGRGIALLTDRAMAERAFALIAQHGGVIYQQEFLPHGDSDYRVLVIGEKTWTIRRRHASDWRTNISRGAVAETCRVPDEWIQLARRAAATIGAPLAGVDLLQADDGRVYVLEVNAVPGWRGLAAALEVDIAREVLGYLESRVGFNSRER
jgi:RimK family alpha-L-glutamate ligase